MYRNWGCSCRGLLQSCCSNLSQKSLWQQPTNDKCTEMFQKANKSDTHARWEQRSSKNGYRPEGKNLQPVTLTTESLSQVKLTNWIFTEWCKKYESGLCHWMANFLEIWWTGKVLVFVLMIRSGALCAFSLSCLDMPPSVGLAYVINLGAHLTEDKQTDDSQCTDN